MIAAEINEADYRIAGTATGFLGPSEWGPLACGCCLVACEMDPVGPRLLYVMQRRDGEPHRHVLEDFRDVCGCLDKRLAK